MFVSSCKHTKCGLLCGFRLEPSFKSCHMNCFSDKTGDKNYRSVFSPKSKWTEITQHLHICLWHDYFLLISSNESLQCPTCSIYRRILQSFDMANWITIHLNKLVSFKNPTPHVFIPHTSRTDPLRPKAQFGDNQTAKKIVKTNIVIQT